MLSVVCKFRAVLWYPFWATRAHLSESIHPLCWLCRTYLSMIQQCLIASIQLAASSRLSPHSSIDVQNKLFIHQNSGDLPCPYSCCSDILYFAPISLPYNHGWLLRKQRFQPSPSFLSQCIYLCAHRVIVLIYLGVYQNFRLSFLMLAFLNGHPWP